MKIVLPISSWWFAYCLGCATWGILFVAAEVLTLYGADRLYLYFDKIIISIYATGATIFFFVATQRVFVVAKKFKATVDSEMTATKASNFDRRLQLVRLDIGGGLYGFLMPNVNSSLSAPRNWLAAIASNYSYGSLVAVFLIASVFGSVLIYFKLRSLEFQESVLAGLVAAVALVAWFCLSSFFDHGWRLYLILRGNNKTFREYSDFPINQREDIVKECFRSK